MLNMIWWCEHCYENPKPLRIPMKFLGSSIDEESGHPATMFFGCEKCMKAKIVVITPRPETVFANVMNS